MIVKGAVLPRVRAVTPRPLEPLKALVGDRFEVVGQQTELLCLWLRGGGLSYRALIGDLGTCSVVGRWGGGAARRVVFQ